MSLQYTRYTATGIPEAVISSWTSCRESSLLPVRGSSTKSNRLARSTKNLHGCGSNEKRWIRVAVATHV